MESGSTDQTSTGGPTDSAAAAAALDTLDRARSTVEHHPANDIPPWYPPVLAGMLTIVVATSASGPVPYNHAFLVIMVVAGIALQSAQVLRRKIVLRNSPGAWLGAFITAMAVMGIVFVWTLVQALSAPTGIWAWVQLGLGWALVTVVFEAGRWAFNKHRRLRWSRRQHES